MKYTININQFALVKLKSNVTIKEAALLDYLCYLCTSPSEKLENKRIIINNIKFTWLDYSHYIKENPIIKEKSKASLSRKVALLEKEKFIMTYLDSKTSRKYIALLPKIDSLFIDETAVSPVKQGCFTSETDNNTSNNNKLSLSTTKVVSRDNSASATFSKNEDKEKKSSGEKKNYGKQEINECHSHFQAVFGHLPDGTIAKNRQFCNHLLNKFKKSYPEKNSLELVKRLIERAKNSDWHSDKATSFMYLYYHAEAIIASTRKSTYNKVIAPKDKYKNIKVTTYVRDKDNKLVEKND